MTVRVGILGNGFARHTVLPCLERVEGLSVVAIASPAQDRLRETARRFQIPVFGPDHDVVLAESPDLVIVTTPPHRHREQSIAALESGAHVLCEKPTALDSVESGAMLDASQAHPNRLALLDHELRFDPRRVRMREWIREGRIGTVMRAHYRVNSSFRRDSQRSWTWWSDLAQGGGMLGAIGSHAVDGLRDLLGEVASAGGFLHTFHRSRPDQLGSPREVSADELASFWLRFDSGAVATVDLCSVDAERCHELTVTGTLGALRWQEQGPLLAGFGAEGAPLELLPVPVEDDLPENAKLGIPDTDWARSFLRFARELSAALRRGDTDLPTASTFEDGHRNQLVLDEIRAD